jgi:hypothetical protein
MANACSRRAILPTLEPGQAVAPGQYRPHYHLPLGPAGGSDAVALDWSI